jgi:hypothetical protein
MISIVVKKRKKKRMNDAGLFWIVLLSTGTELIVNTSTTLVRYAPQTDIILLNFRAD